MDGLDASVEEVHEVSVGPNSVDLSPSLTDSKPPISSGFPRSSTNGHMRHSSSPAINGLLVNNGDDTCNNKFEGKEKNCQGHTRKFSENLSSLSINEFCTNKVEENFHGQLEGNGLSRNSTERNIFKAAEIAERFIQALDDRVHVETAPIESVRQAVRKFGGILDWKERRKHVQLTLDKMREDIPEYKRRVEVAQEDKINVMRDLYSTRRIIEDLRFNLEKAQNEALQAQQDSALAKIRFIEIQEGSAQRKSVVLKAEIDLAKERHATALANLVAVKEELEQLQMEHASLITQRNNAETKAHESTTTSEEIEKTVEDLTLELISLKESLTSLQATQIIAEEQRRNVGLAYMQEKLKWKGEVQKSDEEVQKLNEKVALKKDHESMLEDASVLLVNLQAEFSAYMEGIVPQLGNDTRGDEQPMVSVRVTLEKTRKELDDIRTNIQKAKDEVKGLWNAAAALRADLEKEKAHLEALRKKEHQSSVYVFSLQEELTKMKFELTSVLERTKSTLMPVELQQATKKVEQAKIMARLARDDMAKAKEEADRAKADVGVILLRLEATSREILAINASKEIAMASANALEECTQEEETEPHADQRSNNIMVLPLEEYDVLSKKAKEADEIAKRRVVNAIEKIKEVKDVEVRSLDTLDHVTKQIDERKTALRMALEKAIVAQDGKLSMENELGKRRAKQDQQQDAEDADLDSAAGSSASKARKLYFPRAIAAMFMTRRKIQSK